MKLMPPKAHRLTTEHIKSRLQKYRLHAHRSKVGREGGDTNGVASLSYQLRAGLNEPIKTHNWKLIGPFSPPLFRTNQVPIYFFIGSFSPI